jgi:hypothetical protein
MYACYRSYSTQRTFLKASNDRNLFTSGQKSDAVVISKNDLNHIPWMPFISPLTFKMPELWDEV